VLYLAEVQKTNRLLGGTKAELKLLAKQQSEYQWVAVPGEETIVATEQAHAFNDRALVLVELTANHQIQTVQDAARQLVGILQQFSRLREKTQSQITEIEGWKESLRIQSQELNRRELELIAHQEEVDRLEAAIATLDQEQQALEAHYQETQQSLAVGEQQGETAASSDDAQARQQSLQSLLRIVENQQASLSHHWQTLGSEQQLAQEQQATVEQQAQDLSQAWQAWQQVQQALGEQQLALERLQQQLHSQAERADWLRWQQQALDTLHQPLAELAAAGEELDPEIQELLDLPLEALQAKTLELQDSLASLSRFVQEQEEELSLQRQTAAQLQTQFEQAGEADLAETLAFEQQRSQMLAETLVGQRQSMRERQLKLKKYQTILQHRQDPSRPHSLAAGLQPILESLASQQQHLDQQQRHLAAEMTQLQDQIASLQAAIADQLSAQASGEADLQQRQQALQQQQQQLYQRWAGIQARQELLQPLQDSLNTLSQELEGLMAGVQQS